MRKISRTAIASGARTTAAILALLFAAPAVFGETAWISDEFEVMLRTGPSTNNAIERMLRSGTQLEVIEEDPDSGYSRVTTRDGLEGWVLSRYLMPEPAARQQLATLTQQLTNATEQGSSMSSQLAGIRNEHEAAKARIAQLEQDNAALQEEIENIRRTAANVLAIDKQNMDLRQQLTDAEIKVSILEQENDQLSSRTTRNWFITGALVLFCGILLGLLLPRMSWSRRSRYDRF
ncbi:MAG: TIGR04211 family SH3 domain-containing protein [Woeseiaceae bacterium]|nr:TIGR04211 family SH3 domain-containing protein [Woeseiaceae bacterium]